MQQYSYYQGPKTITVSTIEMASASHINMSLFILLVQTITATQSIENKKNCMHIDWCSHFRFLTSLADHLCVLHNFRQHFTHLAHFLVFYLDNACFQMTQEAKKQCVQLPTEDVTSYLPFVIHHYLVCTTKLSNYQLMSK